MLSHKYNRCPRKLPKYNKNKENIIRKHASSILNSQLSERFKLKSENKHRTIVSPALFNIILEVLINTISYDNFLKENFKWFPSVDDIMHA